MTPACTWSKNICIIIPSSQVTKHPWVGFKARGEVQHMGVRHNGRLTDRRHGIPCDGAPFLRPALLSPSRNGSLLPPLTHAWPNEPAVCMHTYIHTTGIQSLWHRMYAHVTSPEKATAERCCRVPLCRAGHCARHRPSATDDSDSGRHQEVWS